MIDRRAVLQAGFSSVLAGGIPSDAIAAGKEAGPESLLETGAALLRAGPLMNLERAYQVMAEDGLDGLILCHPTNVFHLTGYTDHVALMHDTPSAFVLLARDPRQAPGLVMSQFLYYYSFADTGIDFPLQTFLFTGWDSQLQPGQASPPFTFGDTGQAPLRRFERRRIEVNSAGLARAALSNGAGVALSRAARAMGLDRGRVGHDSMVVPAMCAAEGLNAVLVPADRSLRRVRMIKSAREISMMRLAAKANADAALAAVKSVRAGANHAELRAAFVSECARRGATAQMMQIDTILAETSGESLQDGSAFAIDCLSHGLHYFGDFGRTVFVGEPTRTMKRATDAISLGWDAVREQLRPGLRYSDIKRIGTEALRKAGYQLDVAFTCHSVGLSHTDEPGRGVSGGYWVKDDILLQENMILSVDLPVRQAGMGGSAHLEDLTLITRTGGEQINDTAQRTITI